MKTVRELWSETAPLQTHRILGAMIRDHLAKESVVRVDLSYLGRQIDSWWTGGRTGQSSKHNRSELRFRVLEWLKPEHLQSIQAVGRTSSRISAILLEHLFSQPDRELGRLVHEVMSDIAGIVDIQYPYEDHKELYPQETEGLASDWGKGLGIIRPHSDDLYEERSINAMCLTVCRDLSSTPTWFWPLKDVISSVTDEELGILSLSEATFLSGTNVEGRVIEAKKQVLRQDPEEGLGMRLDFRIDDSVGARMRFQSEKAQAIFDRMRAGLRDVKPISSNPSTGSVSILANYKVLHGRSALNPLMLHEGENSRILFRSKGMK